MFLLVLEGMTPFVKPCTQFFSIPCHSKQELNMGIVNPSYWCLMMTFP